MMGRPAPRRAEHGVCPTGQATPTHAHRYCDDQDERRRPCLEKESGRTYFAPPPHLRRQSSRHSPAPDRAPLGAQAPLPPAPSSTLCISPPRTPLHRLTPGLIFSRFSYALLFLPVPCCYLGASEYHLHCGFISLLLLIVSLSSDHSFQIGSVKLTTMAFLVYATMTWSLSHAAPVMTLVGTSTQVSIHAVTDPSPTTAAPSESSSAVFKSEVQSGTEAAASTVGDASTSVTTAASSAESTVAPSSTVNPSSPAESASTAGAVTMAAMEADHEDKTVRVTATSGPETSPVVAAASEERSDEPKPTTATAEQPNKSDATAATDGPTAVTTAARQEEAEGRSGDQSTNSPPVTTPEVVAQAMEKASEASPVPVAEFREDAPTTEAQNKDTTVATADASSTKEATASPDSQSSTEAAPVSTEVAAATAHAAVEAHSDAPVAVTTENAPQSSPASTTVTPASVEVKAEPSEPVQAASSVNETKVEAPKAVAEAAAVEKAADTEGRSETAVPVTSQVPETKQETTEEKVSVSMTAASTAAPASTESSTAAGNNGSCRASSRSRRGDKEQYAGVYSE
ncbi:hypothetical protein HPB50_002977 [Hyalomma asiaticum]|uniref:Uncharacterized protein n=1 Tax=Hyalomma asiaticum TaxID=266040 RepID=A0ACB7SLT4_HYAAI|nr:hypothetical protein HPB50_002977 [Hyalomma asiaticum]